MYDENGNRLFKLTELAETLGIPCRTLKNNLEAAGVKGRKLGQTRLYVLQDAERAKVRVPFKLNRPE